MDWARGRDLRAPGDPCRRVGASAAILLLPRRGRRRAPGAGRGTPVWCERL